MSISDHVSYDEHTGIIKSKRDGGTCEKVKFFKSSNKHYKRMFVNGKDYLCHRLAFLIMTGSIPDYVDHLNGDGTDNRWVNLRSATQAENNLNKKVYSCNSTGFSGVTSRGGKFRARIRRSGVLYNIGTYETIEEAAKARKEKEMEFGFHENHGTRKESF